MFELVRAARKMIGSALLGAVMITPVLTHASMAAETGQTHQIRIEKFKFVPAELTIKTGDTVEWTNGDIAPHTATESAREWDTKTLSKGKSGVLTFSTPGVQSYICRFHPNMKGKITVVEK